MGRSYDEQAIEAAYLHTHPGFYFLGPFARRVSFASQQYRAIDLVSALEDKGKLQNANGRRKSVAVIGGGVAGLTAAALLRGLNCPVRLFEAERDILHLQREAAHRLIHPTISRWPASELDYTTAFGFMDWYATTGDQVVGTMKRDWTKRCWVESADHKAYTKAAIERLVNGQRVSLRNLAAKTSPAAKENTKSYDICIVATGFGVEGAPTGLKSVSYWSNDEKQIAKWRKSDQIAYVSGCGDGGLIDCLRLVHGRFDRGWLTIRLAQYLTRTLSAEQLDKIEAAEDEALLIAKSVRCMRIANPDDVTNREEEDGSRRITDYLERFYRDFVEGMPADAKAFLDRSIDEAGVSVAKVQLLSKESAPYTPYSAPIHKIMLQHAQQGNFILYRQGVLHAQGDSGAGAIKFSDKSETQQLYPEDPLVIRHGSEYPLRSLVEAPSEESLRLRQFMLSDFIDTDRIRDRPSPPIFSPKQRHGDEFFWTYLQAVGELLQIIVPGSRVGWTGKAFTYTRTAPPPAVDPQDFPPLDIPKRVFGVDLLVGEQEEVDAF